MFAFLDLIDYKKGGYKKNVSISNIHDLTHAIYATVSDIVITGDERLCNRLKAVYSKLGVNTLVYCKKEFIGEDF